VAAHF